MKISDLAERLAAEYSKALSRDKVLTIHLFGIRYADQIGTAANQVIEVSGLPKTYAVELRKAMKIAAYVTLR
ncbi:MAG TPA: hypothetical protein VEZ48_06910 [Sphingomonadaceae bacterium]|nr:hypothetical protein [Sphingomonadaceae bacterium]